MKQYQRRRSPKNFKTKKILNPKGFQQKMSKGPDKGSGFKWKKKQLRSKSPLFLKKKESNQSVIIHNSNIILYTLKPPGFNPMPTNYSQNTRSIHNIIYISSKNIVVSENNEGQQFIGILLKNNINDNINNELWFNIMKEKYCCNSIRSNFHYDGFSIFQILNLQHFDKNCPFYVEWIKTDIYTSCSFNIHNVYRNYILYEQYFIDDNKYQTRFDDPRCCNYILQCDSCGVFFKTDKRCNKCRWCSA